MLNVLLTLAVLDTQHFTFHALGRDHAHALEVMRAAWNLHAVQYLAHPFEEFEEDVQYYPMFVGDVLRDGDPLYREQQ